MARIAVQLPNGQKGTIDDSEFDPKSMQKIDMPQQAAPQQATAPAALVAPTTQTTTTPSTLTGHSIQEHQQALQAAMRAGDKNAIKAITNDLNKEMTYQSQLQRQQFSKEQKSTGLSSDSQKRHDALQTAYASLDGAEQNLVQAGGAKGAQGFLSTLPVVGQYIDPTGAAYHNTKIELATQMAKAITGGARPAESVIQKYLHSLPDVTDNPQYAQDKLNKLRNELGAQAKSFKYDDLVQANPVNAIAKPTEQDSGNPLYDALKANPVTNLLLGQAQNVAQDIGTGLRAQSQSGNLQKTEQQAQQLEDKATGAYRAGNMQLAKILFSQANQARGEISSTAADTSKGFSQDVQIDPISRATGAAAQIATTGEGLANLPGIIKGGGNILDKVLHPFKAVGEARDAAIALNAGKSIAGDKIVGALAKVQSKVPSTEADEFNNLLQGARASYGGKEIPVGDAVSQISHLNDAFNASGKVGKSAKALVEKALGDAFRSELTNVAPEVSKANSWFRKLYGAQKIATHYGVPAAVGGAGTGIGVMAIDKMLGKK